MSEYSGDVYLRRHVRPKKAGQVKTPTNGASLSGDDFGRGGYGTGSMGANFWLTAILLVIISAGLTYLVLNSSLFNLNAKPAPKEVSVPKPETSNGMVLLQQEAIIDWMRFSGESYYPAKKTQALELSASQSDNLLLGFYEQYQRREKVEAAVHYLFAGLGGYVHGRELLDSLSLTAEQRERVQSRYVDYHTRNGGRGFLRLGQLYLDERFEKSGPMAIADRFYGSYGAYLPARNEAEAYRQFQMAANCGYGEANDWLSYMAPRDNLSVAARAQLKNEAEGRLAELVKDSKVSREKFCKGDAYQSELALKANGKERSLAGGLLDDASKAYRDKARQQNTSYDGEDECVAEADGGCDAKQTFLSCADESRYYLNRGEAEMAVGATGKARAFFSKSIKTGRKCGAESAVQASRLLGALNLTCEYSSESVARISRGGEEIIDLKVRQKALSALGHYQGNVDGKYGQMTRRAISDFQRELGFQETGDLSPIETVYLFCSAADNARDRNAKNVLGLMYVTGLGVVQNTDTGLLWLKDAAESGDVDALYNLAIIYGSGTVLGSYRLCDVVENTARADAYLLEAATRKHPIARKLVDKYGSLGSAQRWKKIVEELERTQFYKKQLSNVGKACEVNLNGDALTSDIENSE